MRRWIAQPSVAFAKTASAALLSVACMVTLLSSKSAITGSVAGKQPAVTKRAIKKTVLVITPAPKRNSRASERFNVQAHDVAQLRTDCVIREFKAHKVGFML